MLETVSLFSGLSAESLAEIEQHSSVKSFRKNAIIISQDDESYSLYVILSGRVKVFVSGEDGREAVLNYQGAGDYFGDLALIDKQPRVASVMATEASKFMIISREDFLTCLSRNPEIAINLIKPMTSRMRMLAKNVSSLALMDVYGRVARTLLDQATEKDGEMVTGRITQQEIADMVGASRAMVSRILKDLKQGGYISIVRKRILIHQKLPGRW
ncbi:MAG: Crp/Fnr family transcriptional regulator [Gammaproteobacteria bacterium]|jgi:CRP/FNR family cyclic AMP-dependent transcriptional regulator|nr:Crp/Fnr family transcriptional regulator [Gammaproteobacteria bacterium]MDH3935256.1 Crp/Fnr family transcriptional regulator [Gammaproteobacteria bacterium]